MPVSTLFICGFVLLKTNDAEAVLWASNELFVYLIELEDSTLFNSLSFQPGV